MGLKRKECCVLIYNSFLDPLVQNTMVGYMQTLSQDLGWRFHLITFEQPDHALDDKQFHRWHAYLLEKNIVWYPKIHRTGRFLLAKKVIDFASVSMLLLRLRVHGVKVMWSFANVAASIGWVYSRLFLFKTIIYSYEPHSDFMLELGLWNKGSVKYRILNFLERRAGIEGNYILTGTKYMVDHLGSIGARGKLHRAPTGVDEHKFYYRPEGELEIRKRYQIGDSENIILYIGKFGGLYYTREILLLSKLIQENIPGTRTIIITSNSRQEIETYCAEAGLNPADIIYETRISDEDVKRYMSAATLGISAVPPSPSQKFRSPTKVAEYLLCGLPYITCEGVSEDDIVALEKGVGIVLKEFSYDEIMTAIPGIEHLLRSDRASMRMRCRSVGLEYRSKRYVDHKLKEIFNEIREK